MQNIYCQYCWPTKRRFHFLQHVEFYMDIVSSFLFYPFKIFSRIFDRLFSPHKLFDNLPFDLLYTLGVIEFIDNPDETQLYNRSLVFFKEAKRRKIPIRAIRTLGAYIKDFQVIINNKKYYYEGIPLTINYHPKIDIDNKHAVKKLLKKNHFPVASGKCFLLTNHAVAFAKSIGYPVVVKPNTGSLSYHTTCNISNERDLRRAIAVAQKFRPDFIVEKFVEGHLYRATCIGRKHVLVCRKDRANVIGDGISTILELIQKKNNNSLRGRLDQKNTTLHQITIDEALKKKLKKDGLFLKCIPRKNEKIYLQDKYILSSGCDIIDCTEIANIDNKKLFLTISQLLDTDIVGIDFICPDIGISYKKQKTAILETNSLPYIDMHQYPSRGKSYNVASLAWDVVLAKLCKN